MLPDGPYNSNQEEARILKQWLESGAYKPEYNPDSQNLLTEDEMKNDGRTPWCLVCPPPNAYGRPHIGNISGYAYIDAMARYQRMQGKKVLVLPGKDHAGLEGEGVFVREVLEKQKRYKFDMQREDFYQEIMQWMKENMAKAQKDEVDIGLSADFDRDTFTLDEDIVETVLDTFVEMYKDGRIYKGVRIVNWDPKARTAVADNQIEYVSQKTPFFYFKYSFAEPEQNALQLKKDFEGKDVHIKITSSEEDSAYLEAETHNGVRAICIGFDQVPAGNEVTGVVIGIQMRLDGDFRLVVRGIDFTGDIHDEVDNAFISMQSKTAGGHIILFDENPNDSAYTNGFVIGTVRPETIFADTAIACDSKDDRYKEFVGKKVKVSFLGEEKELNFIEDYAVDKNFGTGLLKVTPAHAVEDWEIAQRNPAECLPAIQVIGYDLKMNHLAGKYEGLKVKEAREAMIEDMRNSGNLVYLDQNYENNVAIAERTKAPIEPLLSSQWYLKYDGLKEAANEMVKNGEVKIHPESMVAKFNHWMDNLRDWAISRSLWWGYRLPVWYHGEVKEEIGVDGMVREYIKLSGETQDLASVQWKPLEYDNPNHMRVQKVSPGEGWIQDEDVLDTWFSSGQWPFATLTKHNLMNTFYPTDVLVSGFDILENWDSRMMMFSYFKTKKVPFRDLYLTGLVKGTDGQKMSKSKGNVIDIDKVKEEYGTDAVRMVYFYQNSAGASYAMTFDKLKNFKQFMNKIWNASRFILMNLPEGAEVGEITASDMKLENSKKILKHTEEVKKKVTKYMENFEFGYATEMLYQEFWHTFCDANIEESKKYVLPVWNKETKEIESEPDESEKLETTQALMYTLKSYLKLLHPFVPFITQRIWNEVPKTKDENKFLMYTKW